MSLASPALAGESFTTSTTWEALLLVEATTKFHLVQGKGHSLLLSMRGCSVLEALAGQNIVADIPVGRRTNLKNTICFEQDLRTTVVESPLVGTESPN